MRKSIIINIVLITILSLAGCTNNKPIKEDLDSVNQKIKELKDKNIQSKLQEEKLQEEKDLPKNYVDALRIVLKEDGKFLQEQYEYCKDGYIDENNIYSGLEEYFIEDENTASEYWDIPMEKGFNIGMFESLYYFVGMETGNVYAMPNQGTMKAYQIKDNKIHRVCEWLGDDKTDHDWR